MIEDLHNKMNTILAKENEIIKKLNSAENKSEENNPEQNNPKVK